MILKASFKSLARNFADVVHDLGDIPLERIRAEPPPGLASAADLNRPENKLCELIDGVLVEKAMGSRESLLGSFINARIWDHVRKDDLGVVLGADGHIWVGENRLRAPDATFIPWASFPDQEIPEEAWWSVAPGLCVEVLSPSNTVREIERKLRELFEAGCQLAWVIDPGAKAARVYTSPRKSKTLDIRGILEGGKVLPGFRLPLADVFAVTKRRKKK